MAVFKIKLEDDTLFDYETAGTLDTAILEIRKHEQFIPCKDYRGKSYYVNKEMVKLIYSEVE